MWQDVFLRSKRILRQWHCHLLKAQILVFWSLNIEEAEDNYCYFGLCINNELKDLPFPQNMKLTLAINTGEDAQFFYTNSIPVLSQPLSSNRYYVIKRRRSHIYIYIYAYKISRLLEIDSFLIYKLFKFYFFII